MILELIAVLFVIRCTSMLARLIERRRDVLYHVSRPDPH